MNSLSTFVKSELVPSIASINPGVAGIVSVLADWGLTIASGIADAPRQLSIMQRDDLIWKLVDNTGVSLTDTNYNRLVERMAAADQFVQENSVLFEELTFLGTSIYDAGKAVYNGKTKKLSRRLHKHCYMSFARQAYIKLYGSTIPIEALSDEYILSLPVVKSIADQQYAQFEKELFDVFKETYVEVNDSFQEIWE